MRRRLTLYADEGKVLTNGTDFCVEIQLAEGEDGADFYEVSVAEAEQMQAEAEEIPTT